MGDCTLRLGEVSDGSVRCCVTSPPYWGLRDYGVEGQLGLEQSPHEYVAKMVAIFREVRRVLTDDGTLWLNLGDSYSKNGKIDGLKNKDLVGIPWMVALALREDGWYLRNDIIWNKPNLMPEPVKDRCMRSHEHVFLLAKSKDYYFDLQAIREPSVNPEASAARYKSSFGGAKARAPEGELGMGTHMRPIGMRVFDGKRNRRDVWTVKPKPFKGAHFATFPPALVEPCVLAGSQPGDIVLDPFTGSGTTGMVALQHGRGFLGVELNPEYATLAWGRITGQASPDHSEDTSPAPGTFPPEDRR